MNSPGANLKRQQRVWLASLAIHKPPETGTTLLSNVS
nr:MAG TPA: hypothetical protein [Caudoviricetes sp.]